MSERQLRGRALVLLLLGAGCLLAWLSPLMLPDTEPVLAIHFLDVGQGDAILLESPSGEQMLVDGGSGSQVLPVLAEEMGYFDRTLDYVVATHFDSDHIGGLIDVLKQYEVQVIVGTDAVSETATARAFARAATEEGAELILARRGRHFDLGEGVVVEVLWPETSAKDMESNTGSIVLKISYGTTSFMLTGDAPKMVEEYLVLAYGEHLQSTVLKAGHHGSRTSTSELFLSEVAPQYAVISAGENNRYGHPHVEVTDMLFNHGIETLSTAEMGNVTFLSDGQSVWVEE